MRDTKFVTLSTVALAGFLPACQSVSHLSAKIDPTPNMNTIRETADAPTLVEAKNGDTGSAIGKRTTNGQRAELIYGNEQFFDNSGALPISDTPDDNADEGQSFVFRNAPVDAVLNQVLGEAFGLSYTVDPNVQGSITVRLDGISTPAQAVAGLDAALGLQGMEIVERSGSYIISRKGQVTGSTSTPVFVGAGETLLT